MKAPIDAMLDTVEMQPIAGWPGDSRGLPVATHRGILRIGSLELEVIQLDTGQRIITAESLERALGIVVG